jgi:hypothetical protein
MKKAAAAELQRQKDENEKKKREAEGTYTAKFWFLLFYICTYQHFPNIS